jgi:hypothetical protein
MVITMMNDVPGHEIEEVLGEVFGITVRSRNVGSQLGASLKSMRDGELNVVVAFRFDSSELGSRPRVVADCLTRAGVLCAHPERLSGGLPWPVIARPTAIRCTPGMVGRVSASTSMPSTAASASAGTTLRSCRAR